MKKTTALLLCLFVYAASSFAAEIVFSPGIGFSTYTARSYEVVTENGKATDMSKKKATYTLPAISFGLDMHFTHEKSGFTFSLINNAAFPVAMHKRGGFGNESLRAKGFIWDGQMLFGYTYGVRQPFSIHVGIGPGIALGALKVPLHDQYLEATYHAWTPVALHLGFQYVFTEHVGIAVGLHDMLSFSGLLRSISADNSMMQGTVGFGNVFTLRVAATFRI